MAVQIVPLVARPLFGGAITIGLPSQYLDASNFREIPDNQEVWTDNLNVASVSSQSSSCPSVIVEILSRSDDVSNSDIANFMFQDLADANHVSPHDRQLISTFSESSPNFPNADYVGGGIGKMRVEKNRNSDLVFVFLWVIRLKHIETDLLISFNDPCHVYATPEEAMQSPNFRLFKSIAQSLKVEDWNLFA